MVYPKVLFPPNFIIKVWNLTAFHSKGCLSFLYLSRDATQQIELFGFSMMKEDHQPWWQGHLRAYEDRMHLVHKWASGKHKGA